MTPTRPILSVGILIILLIFAAAKPLDKTGVSRSARHTQDASRPEHAVEAVSK